MRPVSLLRFRALAVSLVALAGTLATAPRSDAWSGPVTPVAHDAKLASGAMFTCAIDGSDTVLCWGDNSQNQLGLALLSPMATPQSVALPVAPVALAAGMAHVCALGTGGEVFCWGSNSNGQTGPTAVGSTNTTPRRITLPAPATAVSAAGMHSCAVLTTAAVACWGGNADGQLGDGSTLDSAVPVTVSGLAANTTSASAISSGYSHTCAITTTAAVACWGTNIDGQLGNASNTSSPVPVTVAGLTGVTALDAGTFSTCAVANATARCWGYNSFGELGTGSSDSTNVPALVTAVTNVTTVSIGETVGCFATSTNDLFCSGSASSGQLGNLGATTTLSPVAVSPMDGITATVSAGASHVCAQAPTGELYCWGDNTYGQVGDASVLWSYSPLQVMSGHAESEVLSVSESNTCRIAGSNVSCWGDNTYGQLGDGTTTEQRSFAATQAAVLPSAPASVVTNSRSTCAVLVDGQLWCWGLNFHGQLGDNTNTSRTSPVRTAGASDITDVSLGTSHTCAVNGYTNSVLCWGSGANGRLGNASTTSSSGPAPVVGTSGTGTLTGIASVALGDRHSCALAAAGQVYCWGFNSAGELGNASTSHASAPVAVTGIATAVELTAGAAHSCARLTDGSVWCWGENLYGQLGNASTADSSVPVQMQLSSSAVHVRAGGAVTCAILDTGAIECTGRNESGALGDGGLTNASTPVAVGALPAARTPVSLAVATSHVCARVEVADTPPALETYCWGTNTLGVLGVQPWHRHETKNPVSAYTPPAVPTTTAPPTSAPATTAPPTSAPTTTAPPSTTPPVVTVPSLPKLRASCSSSARKITCRPTRPSFLTGRVTYRLSCSLASSRKTAAVTSSKKRTTVTVSRLRAGKTYSCTLTAVKSGTAHASTSFSKRVR